MHATKMAQSSRKKVASTAQHHRNTLPNMVVEDEPSRKMLTVEEVVRQKCLACKGRMTVAGLERIVRDEIIARGKETEKKQREQLKRRVGPINENSFQPVLCTQTSTQKFVPIHDALTGPSLLPTIHENTDFDSGIMRRCWSFKLPKFASKKMGCLGLKRTQS